MTAPSLVGLTCFNFFLLALGTCVLWGVRGWTSWADLVRLLGVAYLLGVASAGVVIVCELVAGAPLTPVSIVLTGVAISCAGLLAGRLQRRPRPVWDRFAIPSLSIATAICVALVVVYLEAAFRLARLHGVYAFDAWAFWLQKAKVLYYFEGLDDRFFGILGASSYPPLIPSLEASAFVFMGSADVVTLHLQFWFLLVGFVAAIAGVLSSRVPWFLLWPVILAALAAPRIASEYLIAPQADFALDYLFVLGALLVGLWLLDRERWQLLAATILFAGAMLTKREGLLLVACAVGAALAVTWRDWRFSWPRLTAVGLVASVATIPWWLWFTSRGLEGDGPGSGYLGIVNDLDRAWPSFRLSLEALFDYRLWLLCAPFALAGIVLAFLGGGRRLPSYAALVLALLTAGSTWVTWSFTELPISTEEALNPVVRLTEASVLFSVALLPLLLATAWAGEEHALQDGG